MTAIIDGKLVRNELAKTAMGGTELMAIRMIENIDPEILSQFNIIHQRVEDGYFANGKPTVLVLHDLPNDPSSAHLRDANARKRFAKIVPCSNWQMQMYNIFLGLPYKETRVIHNMVSPLDLHKRASHTDPIKIIYHTTPHRGLELLVPVFERLAEEHTDIELHVYSSFRIYGWDERDKPYEELFARIDAHPRMHNHGTVSNEEMRAILPTMDIYAYPSIWPECCSLAMIEAQSAGLHIVTPNYASLPETTLGAPFMYQWSEDAQTHAQVFAQSLHNVITLLKAEEHHETMGIVSHIQSDNINNFYAISNIVPKWLALFEDLRG